MKGKILIVEDEKKLADVMALYLRKENYNVTCVYDGEAGETAILNYDYNLIILDIMMPKKDGWSLLRKIKAEKNTPVILTTARGEEEDRIFGLELGADDYMVKPLSMRELVLRVNLRIKNRMSSNNNANFSFETMNINEINREVFEDNIIIPLTPKEFDLLLFLCKNPNQVFSRDHLLNKVWEYDYTGDTRTVDTHIKKLREKINFCNKHIKTVWGVGYKCSIE
ncbi:response regulator transcription factor [Haloimpatiens sp. FM7330]|uniref:response regulator transcription factor n=1 Tax=Haloimpatiens sp. FM7330 TaxID=3298610 RepID=UPI0036373602